MVPPKKGELTNMTENKEVNAVLAAAVNADPEEKDRVCWVKA